jgi:hypothetical protein
MATQTPEVKSRSGRGVAVHTEPTPRQLATPTDLEPEQVEAITQAVNRLIADALVLYLKTKNYHWHLAGAHFRDYHPAVRRAGRDAAGLARRPLLDKTEKRIWFLFETAQGGRRAE